MFSLSLSNLSLSQLDFVNMEGFQFFKESAAQLKPSLISGNTINTRHVCTATVTLLLFSLPVDVITAPDGS